MAAMANAAPVIVGAKVDPALKHDLAEIAERNERNVSQEIRLALRRHVDAHRAIALAAGGAAAVSVERGPSIEEAASTRARELRADT